MKKTEQTMLSLASKYIKENKLDKASLLLEVLASRNDVEITLADNDKSELYEIDDIDDLDKMFEDAETKFDEYWVSDFSCFLSDANLPDSIPDEYIKGIIYEDNSGVIDEKYLALLLKSPLEYLKKAILIKDLGYPKNIVSMPDIDVHPVKSGERILRFKRHDENIAIPFDFAWEKALELNPELPLENNDDYAEELKNFWYDMFESGDYANEQVGKYFFLINNV